jgi:hypothetical protein
MPLGFGQFPPLPCPTVRASQVGPRGTVLIGLRAFTAGILHPISLDDPPVETAAWTNRPRAGYELLKDVFGRPRQ